MPSHPPLIPPALSGVEGSEARDPSAPLFLILAYFARTLQTYTRRRAVIPNPVPPVAGDRPARASKDAATRSRKKRRERW
jgi:hypothetical protein